MRKINQTIHKTPRLVYKEENPSNEVEENTRNRTHTNYKKLTAKGKTNGIQKIHHLKKITKDIGLNTLTTH